MTSPSFHPLPIPVKDSNRLLSSTRPTSSDVTIVVPVKDDAVGLRRTLRSLSRMAPQPAAIIVVDDGSLPPADVDPGMPVMLFRTPETLGAASARNVGSKAVETSWILFVDAGCTVTADLISAHISAWDKDGAAPVALAGDVIGCGGRLARYITEQANLIPPFVGSRPATLVTANAMVWKAAFDVVGGFDERFPSAGGEDYDLGLRLRSIGGIGWAGEAAVLHDFPERVDDFVARFRRYGRGMRILAEKWQVDLTPYGFEARSPSMQDLANLQVHSMLEGYHGIITPMDGEFAKAESSFSLPPYTIASPFPSVN